MSPAALLAAALLAFAGPTAPDAIDDVVAAVMARDRLPSVALVVGRAGAVVKRAAYGEASLEPKVPATTGTLYPIASATKTFTATAVLLLVREGKLSLDDSVTELLDGLPDAWLEVTPRHLLSHTSGLPDVALTSGREALIADTLEGSLAALRELPLAFPVGSGWSYNQTNYLLLRMLVERHGGAPFEEFVAQRLLEPLGVRDVRFGDSGVDVPGRAAMYEPRDGALAPRRMSYPPFMHGAAGLNTSMDDWYRWADAWAHGRILAREELDVMWSPAELASGAEVRLSPVASYGLGVMIDVRPGRRSVGHSGGGNAAFRYFVDEDLLVVLATNGKTDEDALVEEVAKAARTAR